MPVPPFVEATFPVVLTYVPAEEAVTDAVMVQPSLAGMVPPEREISFPPVVPVIVPPH